MDHIGILERALQTTARHRALWVLGFLWALVGGCGGTSAPNGSGGGENISWKADNGTLSLEDLHLFGRTLQLADILAIVLAVLAAVVILAIISMVIKYALQAGILRSLDRLHGAGAVPSVRRAWHEGWNRRTWRLWLQNLIVDLPLAIIVITTLVIVAAPAILLLFGPKEFVPLVVVMVVGLFILWLVAVIAIAAIVGVLKQLWWRAAVVGDHGFLPAIRVGWRLARRNASDVAIMWLLMVGAGIAWFAVVLILIALFAVLTGGVAVLPAYLMFQSGREVLAVVYGLGAGFLTFVVPLIFAGGLYLIFEASVWAQVYQELVARTADAPRIPASAD